MGTGPVEPTLSGPDSEALRGTGDLLTQTQYPPWLALSTVWFSLPSYEGPWLVRAQRLDATGPIGMGGPQQTMIFVQAATDETSGYRIQYAPTWVRAPGCYAYQVDGQTFTEMIVFRAVVQ